MLRALARCRPRAAPKKRACELPGVAGEVGALRLTTARYFTPSGRSIQAGGISPDIEVLQDVPEELKARTDTSGEASLRGHLKAQGDEKTGSQSYIPPDPKTSGSSRVDLRYLYSSRLRSMPAMFRRRNRAASFLSNF